MPAKPDFPLSVFYDGSCSVCATEIEHYKRKDPEGRLILVDISAADFDPAPQGITRDEFMRQIHVIDRTGRIYRGVDAFWAIWQAFPGSTLLGLCGALITLPLLNPLARLCYRAFAAIRGYLPKRSSDCAGGTCRVVEEQRR
jgi:predicted DCC family thiol-disulfide oxidoreductase YuxK